MAEVLYLVLVVLGVIAVPVLALSVYFGVERWLARRAGRGSRLIAEGVLSQVIHGEIFAYTIGQQRAEELPVAVFYFTNGKSCLVYGTFPGPYRPGMRLRIWREGDDLTKNRVEVIDDKQ